MTMWARLPVQQALYNVARQHTARTIGHAIDHNTAPVNLGRSKAIGEWYDNATPDSWLTLGYAYRVFGREVEAQFKALTNAGWLPRWVQDGAAYGTLAAMTEAAYKEDGFKVYTGDAPEHGLLDSETNAKFRLVHDLFGHVMPQANGSHWGEERAYQSHKVMFSPVAQIALATETRGQNCATLFGSKQGNYAMCALSPRFDSPLNFAPQKAVLMPEWAR